MATNSKGDTASDKTCEADRKNPETRTDEHVYDTNDKNDA